MALNPHEKTQFTGKVTASVSHEIQNVLAIIKERAGLLEDLLALGSAMEPDVFAERLSNSLSSIKAQVQRGVGLTSGLNAFAHTSDHESRQIDIQDMIKRLISITERLIRGKEIKTRLREPFLSITVLTDPVLFQMVVHRSIECLYRIAPPGSCIAISLLEQPHEIGIGLVLESDDMDPAQSVQDLTATAEWEGLQEACASLPGKAGASAVPSGINLTFWRQQHS